jgi:hypothetical protein
MLAEKQRGRHPREHRQISGSSPLVGPLFCHVQAEYSVAQPAHLAFDAAKGVFMVSSPWLFGFAKNGTRYWLPQVLMGTADVLAAIATKIR